MSKQMKELYVGSLSYDTTEYDLEKIFSVSGTVTSVHLIRDNQSGEFKGCGYVRMSSVAEAKDAVASLDGAMFLGRTMTVSIANPQKTKPAGGYRGKTGGAAETEGKAPAAGPRPKTAAKGTGPKAAAGKPAPFKGDAAKPAASKPVTAKPAASKPAASKPATAKPAAAKPTAAKPGFTKGSAVGKPGFSTAEGAKPGSARSGAAKTGANRSGKR